MVAPDIRWVFGDPEACGCAQVLVSDELPVGPDTVFDISFSVTPVPVAVGGGPASSNSGEVAGSRPDGCGRGGGGGRGRGCARVGPRGRSGVTRGRGRGRGRGKSLEPDSAKGAPDGSAALERGQPSGGTLAAAVREKEPSCDNPEDEKDLLDNANTGDEKNPAESVAPASAKKRPTEQDPPEDVPSQADIIAAENVPVDIPPCRRRRTSARGIPPSAARLLGCGKCRYSSVGCKTCRLQAGLVEVEPGTWRFKS